MDSHILDAPSPLQHCLRISVITWSHQVKVQIRTGLYEVKKTVGPFWLTDASNPQDTGMHRLWELWNYTSVAPTPAWHRDKHRFQIESFPQHVLLSFGLYYNTICPVET